MSAYIDIAVKHVTKNKYRSHGLFMCDILYWFGDTYLGKRVLSREKATRDEIINDAYALIGFVAQCDGVTVNVRDV